MNRLNSCFVLSLCGLLAACGQQQGPNKAQATKALQDAVVQQLNGRANTLMATVPGINMGEAEAAMGGSPEALAAQTVVQNIQCQPTGNSSFDCDTKFTTKDGLDEETYTFSKVDGTWKVLYFP